MVSFQVSRGGEKAKPTNPNLADLRAKVKLHRYNEELKEAQMKVPVPAWQELQPHRCCWALSRGAVLTAESALLSFTCPRLHQTAAT